jgi:RNA polymerase sigma-70 factor (ECF subfamily)
MKAEHDRFTEQLLRAQGGPSELFGSLWEEVAPRLLRRLRECEETRALSREDAEDALQEASLRAWASLRSFEACRGSAWTWLWCITRNCAVVILRRRARRHAVSLNAGVEGVEVEVADDSPGPAAVIEAREETQGMQRLLEEALSAAGKEVRQVWGLRFRQGRKFCDIARELKTPPGTIAGRIHALKAALRISFQGGGRSSGPQA